MGRQESPCFSKGRMSIILAIGCGAMMHIAVYLFKRGKHPLYVIMPIMFFILCSFEHCVADAGYFGMAHVVPNLDVLGRLFTMVIGNGIGSLILTKFVEDPKEAQFYLLVFVIHI